jgi:large subunit ribosomal protein L6
MVSRVERNPVVVPSDLKVSIDSNVLSIKNAKNTVTQEIPEEIQVAVENNSIRFIALADYANSVAIAGTIKALVNNIILGLHKGFERKLTLLGVGYRAAVQGKKLTLNLGFAHNIEYDIPNGISIETPSQTEVIIKGIDKQLVGQVAAKIRNFRPPEPYKGKGIRFAGETIILKEGKKK